MKSMKKRSKIRVFLALLGISLSACHPSTQEQAPDIQAQRAGIGLLALKEQAFTDSSAIVFFKDRELQDTLLVCHVDSIAQAHPYINRPQEKAVYWKCLGWNRHRYVLALASGEWEHKAYLALDTSRFRFIPWKALPAITDRVERLSFEKNPVRVSPKDEAMPVAWDSPQLNTFRIKEMYKQWLRVGDEQRDDWIRWVYHDTLYISIPDTLWRAPGLLALPADPTTDPQIHRLNAIEKEKQTQQ